MTRLPSSLLATVAVLCLVPLSSARASLLSTLDSATVGQCLTCATVADAAIQSSQITTSASVTSSYYSSSASGKFFPLAGLIDAKAINSDATTSSSSSSSSSSVAKCVEVCKRTVGANGHAKDEFSKYGGYRGFVRYNRDSVFFRSVGKGIEEDCTAQCKRLTVVAGTIAANHNTKEIEANGGLAISTCSVIGACGLIEDSSSSSSSSVVGNSTKHVPVVLMHGIASEADSMDTLASWISAVYPGIYIKNVEVRSLLWNGFLSSIFMDVNDQVQNLCKQLAKDKNLADGFDLIGFSQGTALTRGYVERCNTPKVRNWISLAGVNGGIFGEGLIPKIVDIAVAKTPYEDWAQSTFSFCQYWKDPYHMELYLNKSTFIADVNNERPVKNALYKENVLALENMVLFYSPNDDVIRPQQAGWFESYAEGQEKSVVPLLFSEAYENDWLGMRTLNAAGKLTLLESGCLHVEHVGNECKDFVLKRILPFLADGTGNHTAVPTTMPQLSQF